MAKKHLKTTKMNTLRMITEQTFIDNFLSIQKRFQKNLLFLSYTIAREGNPELAS